MDHKISSVTIARTPISIKRFPKLCLKKKTIDKNVDENVDAYSEKVNYSLSLSPIYKSNMQTPPFVTTRRPVVRNISRFLICDSDGSAHNSNVDVKSSEGNDSNNKISSNISHIDESPDINTNIAVLNRIETTPESNESSKANITPDTANLMDNLYGGIWRSTPGLFKKNKNKNITNKNINIEDNLINELNSLTINGNIVPSSNDNIDDNVSKTTLDDSDLLIAKKKTINRLSSSDSDDNDELKPSKLNFETSYIEDKFDNKENIEESPSKNIIDVKGNISPEKNNDISSSDSDDNNELKPSRLNFETSFIEDKPDNKENIEEAPKITVKKKILREKNSEIKKCQSKLDNRKTYGFIASLGDNIRSDLRDKKAQYYRDNFKSKKTELASVLFKLFNRNVFESKICPKLSIIWSTTLRKTAGRAHNKLIRVKENGEKTTERRSHIELSIKVLDSAHRLRDTLAHELCHVAVWLIDAQQRDGHGPYWKAWVKKVLQRYPEIGSLPVCHSMDIHFKYSYKCTKCGYKINRHSKSIDVSMKACGYCFGRFECILNKKMRDGVVVSTPVRERREATGFALYVKENYGTARGGNTPHKDTMKYLGREYAKMKLEMNKITD